VADRRFRGRKIYGSSQYEGAVQADHVEVADAGKIGMRDR
jgi:hypothetical protein